MATETSNTFPTFTVTARGESIEFTSAFATLADAYKSLAESSVRSEFANDLMARARQRKLSPKQAAWMHKLATDAVRPSRDVAPNLDLSAVVAMIEHAYLAGKKFPKIEIGDLQLKRAGDRSQHTGTISILYGTESDFEFCGRIHADGTVQRSRGWNDEVKARLMALAADPAKVAGQHGVATGNCSFCNRELTDKRSRSVGYGPICADKFGLPWGDTTVADEADAAAKEAHKTADVDGVLIDTTKLRTRMLEESDANGHDFGIFELVLASYPAKLRAAVEAAAYELDGVEFYEPHRVNGGLREEDIVTQYKIDDPAAFAAPAVKVINDTARADWRSRNPHRRDIGERYSKEELR